MHRSQRPESSPKRSQQQFSQGTNNPQREKKKNVGQHTCATNVSGDDSWKEVMLQKYVIWKLRSKQRGEYEEDHS